MSLFGYFVLARSAQPLSELPAIQRLCSEPGEEDISPGRLGTLRAEGDWQLLQVLGGWSATLADDVAAQTGGPAMSIYVIESEFGLIEARSSDGAGWVGYLNPDAAVNGYDAPPPPDLAEVVAAAVAWAADSGHAANPTDVVKAIQGRVGPFGDGVTEFVETLGFRWQTAVGHG